MRLIGSGTRDRSRKVESVLDEPLAETAYKVSTPGSFLIEAEISSFRAALYAF